MSLPLIIMAAGLSTRFGRLKQLHPLGPKGEAILDYNVYDALRAGFDQVLFVVRPEILSDMRAHVRRIIGDAVPVTFVCQELGGLPSGFRAPPDRKKPWGTGQAVLTAAEHIDCPFAVCNADDLYGPGAFELVASHLRTRPSPTDSVLIGYHLIDTFAGRGGVARGVCVLRREGSLERITEVRDIRRKDGWVRGVAVDGEPLELSGNEIVSMNLWGFLPTVIPLLRRQFERFLDMWGSDTKHEFFLSSAISDQIRLGATNVQVLSAPDLWFGMTLASDHDRTKAELTERIERGAYPADLASAFATKG